MKRMGYDVEARLVELAHAFGNRRDVVVEWYEFGGTQPMWSVSVWVHHYYKLRDKDERPSRIGYADTLRGAVEDAFESIARAKAQTVLDSPDFDLHY